MPVLGILAGFLSGLLGIGGGIVLVPALIFLLPKIEGVDPTNVTILAIATSLFTIIVTAFSSARSHFAQGNVDWKMTVPVAITVALTSVMASHIAASMSSQALTLCFAILLFVLAVQIYRGGGKAQQGEVELSNTKLAIGGGLTGFLASLAGLGGGAILVPYLTYMGANIRKSIGTAAACGMVVALFGSAGYLVAGWGWTQSKEFVGFVHWPSALSIMAFSYLSAPWGVKVGQKLNQMQLKKVFAVFIMLVSVKLIFEQVLAASH